MAGKTDSAVHAFGQLLLDLIHGSPTAFHNETARVKAENTVRKYIDAHLTNGSRRALDNGDQRAAIEDVSARIPTGGVVYSPVPGAAQINYDLLADAIVRAQIRLANDSAPAPAVTQTEDDTDDGASA